MISWRITPCIFMPKASYVQIKLMPPLLPNAAAATASSFNAVITAPLMASGMSGSGAVTRNLSNSRVCSKRLLRISSGLPTRGRRPGFALTMAVNVRSTASIGEACVHRAGSFVRSSGTGLRMGDGTAVRVTWRCANAWSRSRGRPES